LVDFQVSKMFCYALTSNAPETKDNDFTWFFREKQQWISGYLR
jgi:hypothetical protein